MSILFCELSYVAKQNPSTFLARGLGADLPRGRVLHARAPWSRPPALPPNLRSLPASSCSAILPSTPACRALLSPQHRLAYAASHTHSMPPCVSKNKPLVLTCPCPASPARGCWRLGCFLLPISWRAPWPLLVPCLLIAAPMARVHSPFFATPVFPISHTLSLFPALFEKPETDGVCVPPLRLSPCGSPLPPRPASLPPTSCPVSASPTVVSQCTEARSSADSLV